MLENAKRWLMVMATAASFAACAPLHADDAKPDAAKAPTAPDAPKPPVAPKPPAPKESATSPSRGMPSG